MNISRRIVSRVWRRFIQTGCYVKMGRSGSPKTITLREDRVQKCVIQQQQFLLLELLTAYGIAGLAKLSRNHLEIEE